MTLMRVTPGRMVPLSGGVRTVVPVTTKMLHDDTSSKLRFVRASRYTTSAKPSCFAASCVHSTGE